MVTVRGILTHLDAERFIWMGLFLATCVVVAMSDNDTQILSAAFVAIAILMPTLMPVVIFVRIAVRIQAAIADAKKKPSPLPFKTMYPDPKPNKLPPSPAKEEAFQMCF
jgi:hypothetical protein